MGDIVNLYTKNETEWPHLSTHVGDTKVYLLRYCSGFSTNRRGRLSGCFLSSIDHAVQWQLMDESYQIPTAPSPDNPSVSHYNTVLDFILTTHLPKLHVFYVIQKIAWQNYHNLSKMHLGWCLAWIEIMTRRLGLKLVRWQITEQDRSSGRLWGQNIGLWRISLAGDAAMHNDYLYRLPVENINLLC